MRIKETVLGGGLSRLDVEPMFGFEREIPTHVIDDIMRDIIKNKRNGNECNTHSCEEHRVFGARPTMGCECHRHENHTFRCHDEFREPDGIDVHVDRPLRENFRWHEDWVEAMRKYRKLENSAKECDWPAREPMKGHECEDESNSFEEFDVFEEFEPNVHVFGFGFRF